MKQTAGRQPLPQAPGSRGDPAALPHPARSGRFLPTCIPAPSTGRAGAWEAEVG